ncbi:carbohydrate-binding module family 1 protein [Piromyces sp. E2]|nr:carbohydrate-binding module family 1 protein [Piromyces sp. E2]|eukprot:OUM60269.1 carbohydrate-binding module family 1 protein [Piromyces sp. E2]
MKSSQLLLFNVIFLISLIHANAYNAIGNGTKALPNQPTDITDKEEYCKNQTPVTPQPSAKEKCLLFGGTWKVKHEYCYDTYYCEYPEKTTTTSTFITLRTIPVFTKSGLVTSSTSSITLPTTTTTRIVATRPLPIFSSVTTSTEAIPTTTNTTKTIVITTTTTKALPITTTTTKALPITTTTTKALPITTTTTKALPITTTTTKALPITTTTTKALPITTTTTKALPNVCTPVTVTTTEIVTVTVTIKVTPTTNNNQNCATKWGQCGGIGFNGPTCCQQGSSCVRVNDYYSQCL